MRLTITHCNMNFFYASLATIFIGLQVPAFAQKVSDAKVNLETKLTLDQLFDKDPTKRSAFKRVAGSSTVLQAYGAVGGSVALLKLSKLNREVAFRRMDHLAEAFPTDIQQAYQKSLMGPARFWRNAHIASIGGITVFTLEGLSSTYIAIKGYEPDILFTNTAKLASYIKRTQFTRTRPSREEQIEAQEVTRSLFTNEAITEKEADELETAINQ